MAAHGRGKLTFDHVHGQYFLRRIESTSAFTSVEFPVSKLERKSSEIAEIRRGSIVRNHTYAYRSVIMEMGASAKWTSIFESEGEMIAIVNGVLARQKRQSDVRSVLDKIRDCGFYFFDLDLTTEEAESLGWKDSEQP
jgi:hypothetical protein